MKIAVRIDPQGEIASLHDEGAVRVYERTDGGWRAVAEAALRLQPTARVADVLAATRAMAGELGDCRTFVSTDNRGYVYSLLQEEFGFRVWKASGPAEAMLDPIAERDAELAAVHAEEAKKRAFESLFASPSGGCGGGCGGGSGGAKCGPKSPERLAALRSLTEARAEGGLRIDLTAVLAAHRNANSMDVLSPLLEDDDFSGLEILCDHLPRWFAGKLADLGLVADVAPHGGGVRALVTQPE